MGRIWRHMPIHSIWSLSTTFHHMLGGDIGTIPCWVRASVLSHFTMVSYAALQWTIISEDFPILGLYIVEIAWWWLHMPIHSIWSLSTTLHMLRGDVGSIPCWVRASATAQWCYSQAQQWMISEDFPILGLHMLLTYGLMMDPYAHPQRICWEEILEPFHVGLEPQPLYNGIQQWTISSEDFPNLGRLKWW